jgi:hypothetical protein
VLAETNDRPVNDDCREMIRLHCCGLRRPSMEQTCARRLRRTLRTSIVTSQPMSPSDVTPCAWALASRGIPFWDSSLEWDGLRCEPEARFALAEAVTRELLHELQPPSYWAQTLLRSAQERPASSD